MSQPAKTHEGKFLTSARKLVDAKVWLTEIEQQILEIQAKKAIAAANEDDEGRISLTKANMDSDIYGDKNFSDYHSSIPTSDDVDYDVSLRNQSKPFLNNKSILFLSLLFQNEDVENTNGSSANEPYNSYKSSINAFNAPKNYLQDMVDDVSIHSSLTCIFIIYYLTIYRQNHDPLADRRIPRVADREDEYRRRFRNRQLSPERVDAFADGKTTLYKLEFR